MPGRRSLVNRGESAAAMRAILQDEKIIPTFERVYRIRDGRTYEEAGEGNAP